MEVFLFHIGRGGNFYNPGYRTFHGIYANYDDAVDCIRKFKNNLFLDEDSEVKVYKDGGGNIVATYGDMYFDFDGDYDSYKIIPIGDVDTNDIIDVITTDIAPLPSGLDKELVSNAWDFITDSKKDSLYYLMDNMELYGLKHKVTSEMFQTNGVVYLGSKCYCLDYDFQGKIFESISEGIDSIFEKSGLPIDYIENLDELNDKIAIRIERYVS